MAVIVSGEAELRREAAIAGLGERVRAAVAAVVPRGARVALLDFPDYGNVGDSMIWLGQLAALRAAGASVAYAASVATYDPRALRRTLSPGSVVLITGGGNLGDLWPVPAELKRRVLTDLPDFRVVQLPQSIHFSDDRNLAATRTLLKSHPAFTLMVRDEPSRVQAEERLEHSAILCPDVAFALGPMERPVQAEQPIVWLSRTDREGPSSKVTPAAGLVSVDWVEEPDAPAPLFNRVVGRWAAAGGRVPESTNVRMLRARAAYRMHHGARMLARGRVVVSNRLHAMVLTMLMGIPQFVSDTWHGKISALHRTWLAEALPGIMCESEQEALERAGSLAESLGAAEAR